MSERTWLGLGRKDWADFNLTDFASLEDCAKAAAWQMPHKVIADDPSILLRFLEILDTEYAMGPSEFWIIKLGDKPSLEHPTWDEVKAYLGGKT